MSLREPEPIFTIRDGVRLAHFEYGSSDSARPPIILVHGWISDHTVLAPQIEALSRHGRVIAVDLRGHGASDAPEQDYTVEGFADDVAWQCREAGVVGPIVVGASFGGIVALELCGRHPDLASGLVMIDSMVMIPARLRGHPGIQKFLDAIAGPDFRSALKRNAWDLGGDFDDPHRREWIFDTYILGPCERTPQHVAYSSMRILLFDHDPAPAAAACAIPMAYISAETPSIDMARDLKRLKEICPQLVTAKTLLAGHFNTIEVADQVNAMLDRFIGFVMRNRADQR